uniref:Ig-like domain-containing protein n=1 Tax=Oreochromis aureus TaxID=47969 RepID=A0A668TVG9_OREAU
MAYFIYLKPDFFLFSSLSSHYSVVIYLLAVFVAQRVEVSPEVTGYVGDDVTLHCQLIQGPTHTNITQVQWALQDEEGTGKKKVTLIVFNTMFGVNISESPLKERVAFDKHSLVIKALEMKDAGSYTCIISTFPSGAFEGTTKLVVQGKNLNLLEGECMFLHNICIFDLLGQRD